MEIQRKNSLGYVTTISKNSSCFYLIFITYDYESNTLLLINFIFDHEKFFILNVII